MEGARRENQCVPVSRCTRTLCIPSVAFCLGLVKENHITAIASCKVHSIQDLAQPLYGIEQDVSLPDYSLILRALDRRSVCLDNAFHFINGAVESARRDEA